jgi:hypothetical protein
VSHNAQHATVIFRIVSAPGIYPSNNPHVQFGSDKSGNAFPRGHAAAPWRQQGVVLDSDATNKRGIHDINTV